MKPLLVRDRLRSALTVERIASLEALIELREVWADVLARSSGSSLFISHEWTVEWWRHFGHGHRLWVLLVRDQADVLAIAPMMVSRTRYSGMPVRMLEFITNKHVSRSNVIIAEGNEEVLSALVRFWRENAREWDILRMVKIPRSSGVMASAVADLTKARLASYGPDEDERLYFIDSTGSIADYWASRPRKFRKNINEARNHLARAGASEYRVIEDREHLDGAISDLFALDQFSRKRNNPGPTAIYDDTEKAFSAALARSLSHCAVHFLLVDGLPIAGLLTPIFDRTIYFLTTYFDNHYEHLDPGRNLIWRVIGHSWEKGNIDRIDFNGNSAFVQRWTSDYEVLEHLSVCHRGPYSFLIGALKSTKRITAPHRMALSKAFVRDSLPRSAAENRMP